MKYIVAGYGKFGRLAVSLLRASEPGAEILVLDPKADLTELRGEERITAIQEDAVSFLVTNRTIDPDDVIVPMVPFHLTARFVMESLPDVAEIPLPLDVDVMVPNPYRLNDSTLFASQAHFICPDDCPEGDTCTVTGEPRDQPLYATLCDLEISHFTVLVQRSHQILPGIGGYRFSELCNLRDGLSLGRVIVATSCKCHAVMTALRKTVSS